MSSYLRPTALDDALAALAGNTLTVLAGGTDFYPAQVGKPLDDHVLDISALSDLRGIVAQNKRWRIGALTTWTDVIETELPPLFDGLKWAAREVGGVQIQNAGTVAGNVCNASPAADGVPPLLAMDASVELSAADAVRTVSLSEFITGNRQTVRRPTELVTAILVPRPAVANTRSHFVKLGARRYLVISIAMVAGVLELDAQQTVKAARIAIGACSEVAQRLPALEKALIGCPANDQLGAIANVEHLSKLQPIDDVRAISGYRHAAALELVRRLLGELARSP